MDVDPKRVLHTSPDTLAEAENMLRRKYPAAIDPTDSMARAASPLTLVF